jgi:predicted secreted protein
MTAVSLSSALAIFFVLWWVVLFAVLPFGVRSQHEDGNSVPGSDPGAPVLPRMARKLIWTTVLSVAIFAVALWAYQAGYLSVERLSRMMGMPL